MPTAATIANSRQIIVSRRLPMPMAISFRAFSQQFAYGPIRSCSHWSFFPLSSKRLHGEKKTRRRVRASPFDDDRLTALAARRLRFLLAPHTRFVVVFALAHFGLDAFSAPNLSEASQRTV